jgi:AcrR family transcriptional regulator
MTDLLSHGRTRQKQRTRAALIAAAKKLIADGTTPNVEDAAAAAGISRTTAYRYFRNQAELLVAAHPIIAESSLLPEDPPLDVEERLDLVVKKVVRMVVDAEAQYRTMLRLSLDPATPRESLILRQGRAVKWIEDALSPASRDLSKTELSRLARAIRTAVGIEALVWLVDVAGLSRDEAAKAMRWSAKMLVRGALAGVRGKS